MAYNENKISLLDSPTRVATPFVKVTIGDYTFGVFREEGKTVVYALTTYGEYGLGKLHSRFCNGRGKVKK